MGRTTNKTSASQDRKITVSDIEFNEGKLRNLLAAQRKPKKRRYYDVYSDDGVECGETKRKYADGTYKNKNVIEFNVQLTKEHYTNFQNVYLSSEIRICSQQ